MIQEIVQEDKELSLEYQLRQARKEVAKGTLVTAASITAPLLAYAGVCAASWASCETLYFKTLFPTAVLVSVVLSGFAGEYLEDVVAVQMNNMLDNYKATRDIKRRMKEQSQPDSCKVTPC